MASSAVSDKEETLRMEIPSRAESGEGAVDIADDGRLAPVSDLTKAKWAGEHLPA